MATENKVHGDSSVGAALASSSQDPSSQALECEDEVGSTAVIDALKVVAANLFTSAVCECARAAKICYVAVRGLHTPRKSVTNRGIRLLQVYMGKRLYILLQTEQLSTNKINQPSKRPNKVCDACTRTSSVCFKSIVLNDVAMCLMSGSSSTFESISHFLPFQTAFLSIVGENRS